jgi:hypothetical protein
MRKQENIYDLVERASARHAIPRLQLWREAAKALTENELRVLNQSERLSPAGAPTIAKWLSDFRAAVDRYNDPNRGMARILKHIIVRAVDFDRWLRRANRLPRGPKPGTTGFHDAARRLFPKIRKLIRTGQARSPYGAALLLVDEGLVAGNAARETKAKRISELFGERRVAAETF